MVKARVAERGQVTIPQKLRRKLGIRPGTVLDFSLENGVLTAKKDENLDPVDQVYGCLGRSLDTDALMKEIRGPR